MSHNEQRSRSLASADPSWPHSHDRPPSPRSLLTHAGELRGIPRGEWPARILFLAAHPSKTPRLRLDVEAREIETQIKLARYRDALDFRSSWAVSPDDLLRELNDKCPVVLHFSGHASRKGGLAFERRGGDIEWVSASAMADVLRAAAPNLRLVILNACHSAEMIEALQACAPCVIGMRTALTDHAAIRYAAAMYSALAFGKSVIEAHGQGCATLGIDGSSEQNVPIFACRKGLDPSKVYLVEASKPLFNWPSERQTEFLRGIVRRDPLRLPADLSKEIARLDQRNTLLLMALENQVPVLELVSPEAARYPVDVADVPLHNGARYAWFTALQIAALRSPVTLGALLLEVRGQYNVDLPNCDQVLESLCERG